MKDGNRLRIQFREGKGIESLGFAMYIKYDAGFDLYDIETVYYDSKAQSYPVKKTKGIYADGLDEPEIFFPINKVKEIIKKSKEK